MKLVETGYLSSFSRIIMQGDDHHKPWVQYAGKLVHCCDILEEYNKVPILLL